MEAGQSDRLKVAFIIQARMNSLRLPGKILMPLPYPNGKPLLKWITDTLKESRMDKKIILATSTSCENDVLEEYCNLEGIDIFRGDEDDVLSRFTSIIAENSFDVIIRLTADNPILDLKILDNAIQHHVDSGRDYSITEGLPLGMNFEVINPKAILQLQNENITDEDREHVTLFIRRYFENQQIIAIGNEIEYMRLRLTVDYPSDFACMSFLLSFFEKEEISFQKIKEIKLDFPWIFEINQLNPQKNGVVDYIGR